MASLRKKLNLLKSGRLEGEEKIGPAIRETHEYARGQAKAAGAGAAAGIGGKALYDATKEDDDSVDLGEGAVISYEESPSKEKEPKKEVGRLGFPAKKAKGGRPIGVGAAERGYGAVMRKSVGGGLRGVGAAQRGFGAVKKAGKE